LEFKSGESADSHGLTGEEQFSIDLNGGALKPGQEVEVHVKGGKTFKVKSRIDTDVEVEYFKNGGILHFVLRRLAKGN